MRFGGWVRWAGVLSAIVLGTTLNAQTVDLGKDERLQKPITVREPFIPLKQLLAQLGKELNLSLSATTDIAEDKVCVLVRERPAHEVLQNLADTLRYEWQRSETTDGYRLYLPQSERVREQQLRQALLLARRQVMERALRILIDLARRIRWEELTRVGEDRLSPVQAQLLPRLYDVGIYTAARVMGDFRASEWQRFWGGETLIFSSAPRAGELPLAPELHQLILEGRLAPSTRSMTEPARREAQLVVARLRLRWDAWRGDMTVETERESADTPRRAAEGGDVMSANRATTIRHLSFHEVSDLGDLGELGRRSEEGVALLDEHSLNKVWREWANVTDRLTPSRRANSPSERITLPAYLQRAPLTALIEIANRYGLDLYADAYRLELFLEGLPVIRALLLSKTLPADWSELRAMFWLRQQGDALMARHKDYFWLRPSEIPEERLRPLEAKKQKREPIALDDWARLADSLNELQTERLTGLPLVTHAYVRTSSILNLRAVAHALPALRFWASLTPQQKQAALSGEPLLLRRLSIAQRQRFLQACYAPPKERIFSSGITSAIYDAKIAQLRAIEGAFTRATSTEPYFRLRQVRFAREVVFEVTPKGKATSEQPPERIEPADSPTDYQFEFVFESGRREYHFAPDTP